MEAVLHCRPCTPHAARLAELAEDPSRGPVLSVADKLSEVKSAAAQRKRVQDNSQALSSKKHLLGPIPPGLAEACRWCQLCFPCARGAVCSRSLRVVLPVLVVSLAARLHVNPRRGVPCCQACCLHQVGSRDAEECIASRLQHKLSSFAGASLTCVVGDRHPAVVARAAPSKEGVVVSLQWLSFLRGDRTSVQTVRLLKLGAGHCPSKSFGPAAWRCESPTKERHRDCCSAHCVLPFLC